MKTTSVMLQTLCVPCHCRCRYCLLSWDGKPVGLDDHRSQDYARRFSAWMRIHRPDLRFHFSFGYSMDHPNLLGTIDFLQEIGSVSGKFLQLNGMAIRPINEMAALLRALRDHGVEALNFTFYGLPAYHDRFAARKGDFQFMADIIRRAGETGLLVTAGIPLTHENAPQIPALTAYLSGLPLDKIHFLFPTRKGEAHR